MLPRLHVWSSWEVRGNRRGMETFGLGSFHGIILPCASTGVYYAELRASSLCARASLTLRDGCFSDVPRPTCNDRMHRVVRHRRQHLPTVADVQDGLHPSFHLRTTVASSRPNSTRSHLSHAISRQSG